MSDDDLFEIFNDDDGVSPNACHEEKGERESSLVTAAGPSSAPSMPQPPPPPRVCPVPPSAAADSSTAQPYMSSLTAQPATSLTLTAGVEVNTGSPPQSLLHVDATASPAAPLLQPSSGASAVASPQRLSPRPSLATANTAASSAPTPTTTSFSASGVTFIRPASPHSEGRSGGGGSAGPNSSSGASAPPPASAVFTESHSRIRVRRATVSFEQLPVRLAEYPYASFDVFRQAALHGGDSANGGGAAVALTCVGVVTRKSDPKQNSSQTHSSRYAVLTLWSMESISPSPETELSLLLCGNAFDLLYSHLVTGSVVALSNVGMCSKKQGSSGRTPTASDVLLRVADHGAVRQLGFAADLGTCTSVSHKSNERCHAVINKARSQHCSYHVGDLRKVVRGTAGVGGSNPSDASNRKAGTSSLTPVMKGGALTSHVRLSSSSASTPTAAAARTGVGATQGTAPGRQQHSILASLQPSVGSRAAASQQLLRQPSFFAVRGGSGLPVEDAANRQDTVGASSGVYGGVHSGSPLALRQRVGLRPADAYPSAQRLGVSSRGRDVLEAARQQAVLSEEEKLLRRPLRPPTKPLDGSLTVVGNCTAAGASSGSAACSGENVLPGGTQSRRAREDVGGAAPSACSAEADGRSAVKRSRLEPPTAPTASTASAFASRPLSATESSSADGRRVEAIRQQFQPLHRGATAAFTPLSSHGAVHTVIASATQQDYRHRVVVAGAAGNTHQTALLRAAAKAARDVPKPPSAPLSSSSSSQTRSSPLAPSPPTSSTEHSIEGAGGRALTLLGAVADRVRSQHDHLRGEADRDRLLAFVDKQITKEKALEALEAITQQDIKAHYCYNCKCWYGKPPTTCLEQHHRTELKPALKRYIKCEHCQYKTFIIGDADTKGWKVFPRCPRCHQASYWVRGDAAPQVAELVEAPPAL